MKEYEIKEIAQKYCKDCKLPNEIITAILPSDHLIIKYLAIRKNKEYKKSYLIHKSGFDLIYHKESLENKIATFINHMRELY